MKWRAWREFWRRREATRTRSGTWSGRRAAVEVLGRLGVAEAEPLLVQLLADADPHVRRAAVGALVETGGAGARAALQEALHGRDRAMSKAAASALHGGRRRAQAGTSPELTRQILGSEGTESPVTHVSLEAALCFALPAHRKYEERDLTRRIAGVCSDYSATRRYLVDEGLTNRAGGVYELTELGETLWRVEHTILERYLMPEERRASS